MVNFKRLADQARKTIDKRGGMDSVKEDAQELRDIAKGKGSLSDKAKEAGKAIKDPGAKGPDQPGERGAHPHPHRPHEAKNQPPGATPESDEPATRSK
jgi:hypothetical protein